ncbi:putative 2-aminoethylphosphonate ABC transporter ATP-binding protein [Sneathiella chungangensis]|uniref:Putative 2-aminoethylphosphonate ABC transporter ATP-binding protein n=1 Tax=Sneathiella chungangensis TaxID=1418234 RepID=A0A845MCT7_9PROT|nr:putative 2-aminoethylphosphonate ABC transporter ATP-binding protein [Sneathiella chungangensis]MZR21126.1 putative 2-aminoethylphosphonate ABC transporter ATP-binding protein [Sneathiella chungangensis]
MRTKTALENEADESRPQDAYLRIDHLWKAFGEFIALKDISLSISEGEFVCFLGPSGCGKTTLLRAIAGLDLQSRGSVEQAGKDISNLPPAERDFGIVFQSYALFPNLTIEKNVAFGLENSGMARPAIKARVAELLDLVGLPEQGKKYPAQLSGGQQQRIALARAIAMSPGLLLLDEPLSALDAKVRVHLRHEVKALQRKLGITTIMVTHDQEEALSMADRIVVMNHGVIEQIGTPTDIYREPTTLFVADFIGEMNKLEATSEGPGQVTIGNREFKSANHDFATGAAVIAAVRPEDIIPHGSVAEEPIAEPDNAFSCQIKEMEFLGSFWRTRLQGAALGDTELIADFSINAVRRLDLSADRDIVIEIPSRRLKVFAAVDDKE